MVLIFSLAMEIREGDIICFVSVKSFIFLLSSLFFFLFFLYVVMSILSSELSRDY